MLPALTLALLASTVAQDPAHALISVERIWDRAEHQAFTDLVHHDGRWYLAFREGSSHATGRDGVTRVLGSEDGLDWRTVGLIEEEGVDLRDAKLAVDGDGRLMVVMGGSRYSGSTLLGRTPKVSFLGDRGFRPCLDIVIDPAIAQPFDWLWRVTSRQGKAYGVVYQAEGAEWAAHLVVSEDALSYQHVTTFELEGKPNETTLRFLDDGTLVALLRREGGDGRAMAGHASPPYSDWTWAKLPLRLGGPNFVVLPGGELLASGRDYTANGARTILGRFDLEGSWTTLLTLPSGGDTSYPGMVVRGDQLWLSYYSSHEGKTSVYLARLRIPNLLAAGEEK